MTAHYHLTLKRLGLPPIVIVSRQEPTGDGVRECACEAGEIELYHEGIEAREIGEECVCSDCERRRSARFILWREQQAAAGIVAEHTVTGEAGPDV